MRSAISSVARAAAMLSSSSAIVTGDVGYFIVIRLSL
jgi:hypothetical protein